MRNHCLSCNLTGLLFVKDTLDRMLHTDFINKQQEVNETLIISTMKQIASGLLFLKQNKVVHMNVKPK